MLCFYKVSTTQVKHRFFYRGILYGAENVIIQSWVNVSSEHHDWKQQKQNSILFIY